MRKINLQSNTIKLFLVAVFIFVCCVQTLEDLIAEQSDTDSTINSKLNELVNRDYPQLESIYKQLHSSPELSLQEKNTSSFIARELKKNGYEVTTDIGGYGIVGILKNGAGPTVMVRTDMDALPIKELTGLPYQSTKTVTDQQGNVVPVMHACGHDIHMTVFLGVVQIMSELKDNWKGSLMMVAEPAEELGEGAKAMLTDGLFSKFPRPEYALALHVKPSLNAGYVGYTKGYAFATVDSVDITVKGIGGHGAYPDKTIDPVVMASELVMALQTIVSRETNPLESAVVTVGQIHGGTKRNVIPNEVKLELTVRTYDDEIRTKVLESIKRKAKGIAVAYGVPAELEPVVTVEQDPTPAVYNSPELVDLVVPDVKSILGEEKVVEVGPVMGGEDFGRFGLQEPRIPIFMLRLGTSSEEQLADTSNNESVQALHSSYLSPAPEPTIKTGILSMTKSLLKLFNQN